METRMISAIKDNKNPWTCKVRVVERRNIKDSRMRPNKYRPYILQDEEGTKVLALANSGDIEQIDKILDLKTTYYISNAAVMPNRYSGDPPSANYNYIWMLSKKTWIEAAPKSEQIEAGNETTAILTPFFDFYDLCGSKTPMNFMAIVIQRMPREYISVSEQAKTAHDFMIVNEEMKPVLLTLWEDFAINQGREITSLLESGRHPIILAKRVTVSSFNGVSLSTRSDSIFEINPSDPTSERLKKWRDESLELIQNYIETKAYKNALIELAYPPGRSKVKIGDIYKAISPGKGLWVTSDIKIIDNEVNYYNGCDYCNRKSTAPEGVTFKCLDCGNLSARSEKKAKIQVQLSDETGEIEATMFDEDFKRLLSISKTVHHSGEIDITQLQMKINPIGFHCELRIDKKKFGGPSRRNFTVNGLYENIILPERNMNVQKERESTETPSRKRLTFEDSDADHEDIIHAPPGEETAPENSRKKPKK